MKGRGLQINHEYFMVPKEGNSVGHPCNKIILMGAISLMKRTLYKKGWKAALWSCTLAMNRSSFLVGSVSSFIDSFNGSSAFKPKRMLTQLSQEDYMKHASMILYYVSSFQAYFWIRIECHRGYDTRILQDKVNCKW